MATKRTPEVRRLVRWLRHRLKCAENGERIAAKKRDYGDAERCAGMADAYAYVLVNIDRVAGKDGWPR